MNEQSDSATLINWVEEEDKIILGLPPDLDLSMASPLREALRAALARGRPVKLRADAVGRISAACIQALIVASNQASQTAQALTIVAPSEMLAGTCDVLGLAAWLNQWSEA